MGDGIKHKRQIFIVGARSNRVAKVLSFLQDDTEDASVEFFPCVATFDSYENENGQNIRYLVSVDYHENGSPKKSSLVSIFDRDVVNRSKKDGQPQTTEEDDNIGSKMLVLTGIVIGSGIEKEDDLLQIRKFFNNFSLDKEHPFVFDVIKPNVEFQTMEEETLAYRALDAQGKDEASRLKNMGPAKMAQFAQDLAQKLLTENNSDPNGTTDQSICSSASKPEYAIGEIQRTTTSLHPESSSSATTPVLTASTIREQETKGDSDCQEPSQQTQEKEQRHFIDPSKTRYACRKCRSVLFGQDDLQNPPHQSAKHGFTKKNKQVSSTGGSRSSADNDNSLCQSAFLSEAAGLSWMGAMEEVEGRFHCPKCDTKLGGWNWSGAQCSCGTWVTPAIQIPSSKLDILTPIQNNSSIHCDGNNQHSHPNGLLPPGTVVSPLLLQIQKQ